MEACPEVKAQQLKMISESMEDDVVPEDVFPASDIRKCLETAPRRAATGADQWRPHDWSQLPDAAVRELQAILYRVERRMRWPAQVAHNVVVYLAKPTTPPSERPITLTSGLYRLWCKLRRPQILAWETGAAGFCTKGGTTRK